MHPYTLPGALYGGTGAPYGWTGTPVCVDEVLIWVRNGSTIARGARE
jgi:hypothetical protein